MEYHLDLKKKSRDQQSSGTHENTIRPQASQSLKLHEKLKTEKPGLSYADLHNVITNNGRDVPAQSSCNQQKQQINRKATKEEELVKYMSSVPSYLERGEKPQEKVLNVGVLDWGLLEKWQYSQKQIPSRSSRCSPSSSNTSSYFSTDVSSIHSSRGPSCSPSHERTRRPSLQYHLMASPLEGHTSAASFSGENVGKFKDLKAAQSNSANGKLNFIRTDQPFSKNHEVKLGEHKNKVPDPNISRESRTMPKKINYEVVSSATEKMKTRDGEFGRRAEKLQEKKSNIVGQVVPDRQKTVVLLTPRDLPQNNPYGESEVSGQTSMFDRQPAEASRMSFSERSKEHKPGIPHSCPLPCAVDSNEFSHLEQPGFLEAESVNLPSSKCHLVSRSSKIGISPSRGRNLQEKNTTISLPSSTGKEPSKSLDMKASKAAAEKPRSTSPFRRLSIGMGRLTKNSGSKEGLTEPQMASASIPAAKSVSENTVVSTSLDCSSNRKSNSTSRARSSPLRRLLDPLMRPKAASCRQLAEPSQKDSMSTDHACRSESTAQLGKGKLDLNACRETNVNTTSQGKKQGSSTLQALLRVAVKNGLPLFTFAVDNDSDIFAATLKFNTSRKDDHSCIYTFFTIREVKKKKGGWISQGGKGKGHDYIPDVVAQMKVFDAHTSNFARPNSADHSRVKEFVLFSVEQGEEDQGTSNYMPNDELAAIVVKMPKKIHRNSIGDGWQSNNSNNFSGIGLEEHFPKARRFSYSGDSGHNQPLVSDQESIKTTVILPSGTHSLPSKGEPSSLVQRWRSGGSCDCGGWDLGCKLQIFTNSNQQVTKKSSSSSIKDQFELFSQEGLEENQPALSLASFKDGIFSVEFNSSLNLLQAFSTCIAILDGRKLCEFSESSDLFEEKASDETISARNDGTRAVNQVEGELPARYVSYPPLSPVGRV